MPKDLNSNYSCDSWEEALNQMEEDSTYDMVWSTEGMDVDEIRGCILSVCEDRDIDWEDAC